MSLPASLEYRGRAVVLKYHKFNSGLGAHPPNSLSALEHVLEASVAAIECDVAELNDGTLVLMHDAELERETTGIGPLAGLDLESFKALRLRGSSEAPASFAEVAERLAAHRRPIKLQVDVKAEVPLTDEQATRLLHELEPLRANSQVRTVVGCLADWNLRTLQQLDATLAVGFDPTLHLHAPVADGLLTPLPVRVNAYGYFDDHPLGFRRGLPVEAYLRRRFEGLVHQVPGASEVYLHRGFVTRALADGFDPIGFIHSETGSLVDVWTLNHGEAGVETDLTVALDAGADQITTDTAVQLAAAG